MWPDDAISLPTRDGHDVGGAQERTMIDFAGGSSGIRTVEETNADGSVTRLRTRLGMPTFETERARVTSTETQLRGFVAKVPGGRAVLFDPYTMEILKTPYAPAAKLYEVQDFMTESTWYDVVLFDGTTIRVNAKTMPKLRITANHGYESIPHVINYTVGDQYGNAERNASEKRVFAVGRYSVTSWGGGGVTETLTPTEPRTENRCFTIGQRIDGDVAYLGELYHGIDGWDGATEWYFRTASVQMLLTAAYLVKTSVGANVAMTPPGLSATTTTPTSGTISTPVTLPATPVGMTGESLLTQDFNYDGTGAGNIVVHWGFSADIVRPLQGSRNANYSARIEYSGSSSSSELQAGEALNYSAANFKTWDNRSEVYRISAQYIPWADHAVSPTFTSLNADATTLFWGLSNTGYGPGDVAPTRGTAGRSLAGGDSPYPDLSQSRAYETQTGSASVMLGANALVSVSFSREQSTGQHVNLAPNTTYYPRYYGSDRYSPSGMGYLNRSEINYVYNPGSDTIPIMDLYKQNPSPPPNQLPDAVEEVNSAYHAMRDALLRQVVYDSEGSSGYDYRPYGGSSFYYASISPSVALDNCTLNWETKDYLLHDTENGVFITIESTFSGVDSLATLTVLLRVQTRHHDNTQVLGTFNYNYGSPALMLPEREIGTTGKFAIPSPQIRAIFAPLYQEQGSFKGAHYVTLAEEENGATPFHGFNFVLNLRMYSDFDTCNDDNEGQQVYFVPFNLMEMLYAFVFSTEYGVAEDGTRYPVTYASRFNEMRDTLFADPVRVAVRNGSATNWTDALGGDFAAVGTVALYRT